MNKYEKRQLWNTLKYLDLEIDQISVIQPTESQIFDSHVIFASNLKSWQATSSAHPRMVRNVRPLNRGWYKCPNSTNITQQIWGYVIVIYAIFNKYVVWWCQKKIPNKRLGHWSSNPWQGTSTSESKAGPRAKSSWISSCCSMSRPSCSCLWGSDGGSLGADF